MVILTSTYVQPSLFPPKLAMKMMSQYILLVKQARRLTKQELRKWIKDKMPKYMWPKYIRFTVDLPRTPTNKIEKYKLRQELLADLEPA